jgi:hypothetical protein
MSELEDISVRPVEIQEKHAVGATQPGTMLRQHVPGARAVCCRRSDLSREAAAAHRLPAKMVVAIGLSVC